MQLNNYCDCVQQDGSPPYPAGLIGGSINQNPFFTFTSNPEVSDTVASGPVKVENHWCRALYRQGAAFPFPGGAGQVLAIRKHFFCDSEHGVMFT